jgi:hypothetical protein
VEIACIVEGDGEEEALPVLLRRIIEQFDPALAWTIRLHPPIRRPRDQLKRQEILVRVIDLAARRLTGPGAVLVLIDADDACPASLGPTMLSWARAARSDTLISVVLASIEYEAWFLASAESLRGHRGLPDNLIPPPDPEAISGAKEWLSRHLPRGQSYSPTEHQASFSAMVDLDLARQRAPSFDKLCRDVRRLVDAMRADSA